MKKANNPLIEQLTASCKDRTYNLSDIKLPEGLKKACVWCLEPLQGRQLRWCGEDDCVKAALAWGRPQSAHGLYELMKKQDFSCAECKFSYRSHYETAVTKRSRFYDQELRSREIELVMRRFRRLIPREVRPEVDHILAISLGGTALGLENHQILCAACHKKKTLVDGRERLARNGNPRKGVKFTEEHVAALSEARKGVDTVARKQSREKNLYPELRIPIVAINIATGEQKRFNSIRDASKELGLQESNISRVLKKSQNRTQHKGWTFEFVHDIMASGGNENGNDSPHGDGSDGM